MNVPGLTAEASLYQTKHHCYRSIAGLQPNRYVTPQLWMECKQECDTECGDYFKDCQTWCSNLEGEQQVKCEYRCESQYNRCGMYCSDACTQRATAEMIDEWESEHPGGKPWWEYRGAGG